MDNSHKKSSDEVEAENDTIAEANTESELEVDSSLEELFFLCVCRLFDAFILMDNSFEKSSNGENMKMMTVRLLTF
jgi:hypothetical protein